MTPTEQNKELLDSLNRIGFKQGNDGTWWAYDWQYDVTVEVNEHLALIKADRKRVALEARIDELMRERKNDYWPYYSDKADSYNTERLAQLTRELE